LLPDAATSTSPSPRDGKCERICGPQPQWSECMKKCKLGPRIDGGWSEWSTCTKSCGGGIRERSCTNPKPAGGKLCLPSKYNRQIYYKGEDYTEQQDCNLKKCPGVCVNNDRTWDSLGWTCTGHYDDFPQDCGHYDTDHFNSYRQCCACKYKGMQHKQQRQQKHQ
jgi:hypothetical protein